MGIRSFTRNNLRISVTCADVPGILGSLSNCAVELYHLKLNDALTFTAEMPLKYYRKLNYFAKRYGASVKTDPAKGIYWTWKRITQRPVLLFCSVVIAVLSFFIPERILLIEVEGNGEVPANLILEQAAICGIRRGTPTDAVRSELVKNALLAAVPSLQWVGINTYGCRAVISVKERPVEPMPQKDNGVASMIAVMDGVVESCTATKGNLLCKPGQEVKSGDVLISGYTDCGLMVRATRAEGEVIAATQREITVLMPCVYRFHGIAVEEKTKISLIIGKKRINFFKDSGILCTGCDKMYTEYSVVLPGSFVMPITLAIERYSCYENAQLELDMDPCQERILSFAKEYLLGMMISGRITDYAVNTDQTEDTLIVHCLFACSEMIGRVRYEGIADFYGKSD